DGGTGLALGALADQLEHLLQALDMAFGLILVLLEGGLQLRRRSRPRHLGKRLQDLPFGVVNVLERIVEEIVQCLFLCHGIFSCAVCPRALFTELSARLSGARTGKVRRTRKGSAVSLPMHRRTVGGRCS